MARTDYRSVDEYLAAQPAPARPVLRRVRATIRKTLPGATEGISYQIPVFRLRGAMVLYFAGFQRHYSIYPATPRVIRALGREGARYLHSKATLRFSLTEDVPTRLIARIARARVAETATRARTKPAKTKPRRKPVSRGRPAPRRAGKRRKGGG